MVSVCLMILGLTACGKTDPKSVDYNGYTYDQLKQVTQNTVATLVNMTDEQKTVYEASDDEMTKNIVTRWEDATSGVGSYVELGDFKITKSGKTLTCEQTIEFEKREVILTYVYTYYSMEVEDVTIDKVYSLGEKMSKAGMNTLMGMGTVFAVLIFISFLISLFKYIPAIQNAFGKKKDEKKEETKAAVSETVEEVDETDDLELIAVISAAIAAAEETTTDGFVVRSIKRRPSNKWNS